MIPPLLILVSIHFNFFNGVAQSSSKSDQKFLFIFDFGVCMRLLLLATLTGVREEKTWADGDDDDDDGGGDNDDGDDDNE